MIIFTKVAIKLRNFVINTKDLLFSMINNEGIYWSSARKRSNFSSIHKQSRIYPPFDILHTRVGKGTYISPNSNISYTEIGKFCSIGPNLICGWGIHPLNGISTSPLFYSTKLRLGYTFSSKDLAEEHKQITIGSDVFIGANVTILDGVTIGDGAVIGAGSVVSKDIPPYAIAVGAPIRVLRFRFDDCTIDKFKKVRWWDFEDNRLDGIHSEFFDVNEFLRKNYMSSEKSNNQG